MIKRVYFSAIFLLFIACNENRQDKLVSSNKIIFGDSTLHYVNNLQNKNISYFEKIIYAANLDKIDTGFNDLQARIWLGYSQAINHDILIIKYKNNKWSGELLTYTILGSERFNLTFKILDYKNVAPKIGWDNLLNKVNEIQVFSSQKEWETPNCCGGGGLDGNLYMFEIATSNKYRVYKFYNPKDAIGNNLAIKVMKFTDLLETEFGFSYTK